MLNCCKRAICALGSVVLILSAVSFAQVPTPPAVESRIVAPVDDTHLKTLRGNTHPLARAEFDRGTVDPQLPMKRMQLVLQRSDAQEAALKAFMDQQSDPNSPNFHHWLTPEEFGAAYGPSESDIAKITAWLISQGFSVDAVGKGRVTLEFSGTAAQVASAFHTQIHHFNVNGEDHTANTSDPQIPDALSPVIVGVASLNDFYAKPQTHKGRYMKRDGKTGRSTPVDAPAPSTASANPLFSGTDSYGVTIDVAPYDFATIYNSLPLWNAGNTGQGQTIAIAGASDIFASDVATFQTAFGLPNHPVTVIHNGTDAGYTSSQGENSEDVELSGAVAPGASIVLVVSKGTSTTDPIYLSLQYIIDNRVATIASSSYGECELELGTAGNASYNSLYQQGATEGISIFVSSGDSGSAFCDSHNQYPPDTAKLGLAVNGFASSPYVTAVGGTDLLWQPNFSAYWNSTNSANGSSATGYIPEFTWNTTCTSPYVLTQDGSATPEASCNLLLSLGYDGLVTITGSTGGVSNCTTPTGSTPATCAGGYAKPSWQTGTGVPSDGLRDTPDVSLFASYGYYDHELAGSSWLICESSYEPCIYTVAGDLLYQENGGTSASSPAMAGVMALINQKVQSAQGLANPMLYQLAAAENLSSCNASTVANGSSCVFYDVTYGNNTQPCTPSTPNCVVSTMGDSVGVLSGYSAGVGYDLTTGLGSVNIANLAAAWLAAAPPATPTPTITLSIPAHAYGDAPFTIAATSNSTGAFTYTVLSGNAIISGSTVTITGTGNVAIQVTQAAAAGYTAGSLVTGFTVSTGNAGFSWNPQYTVIYAGSPIGSGFLDATSVQPGTFTYYTVVNHYTVAVTASTVLAAGTYSVQCVFSSTNSNYASVSSSITFTVTTASVWITNAPGSVSELAATGTAALSTPAAAGGIGAAIDNAGNLWSIAAGGNALAEISASGTVISSGYTGGGMASASGLAIDGASSIWVANANGSVSQFNSSGTALTPSTGYTGGGMSTPSSVAIDISGNVWVANGNNSVTEILGAAAPVAPIATAVTNATLGAKP